MLKKSRGQSTLEYALIISVVVGALLAMQIYMKRGMEGRMRKASDDIGKQFDPDSTYVNQYTNKTGTSVEEVDTTGKSVVYSGGAPSGSTAKGAEEKTEVHSTETVGGFTAPK